MRARIRERRPRRFLHDVAQLAGQDEIAFARHDARLDEHDVPARRGVIHPRGDADLVDARFALGVDPGPAEELADVGGRDREVLQLPRGDAAGPLAPELPDLALELADAGLARVAGDDLLQGLIPQIELVAPQPVLPPLPRSRGTLRDF